MRKWRNKRKLNAEIKKLKTEKEYLACKWGTEVLKNQDNKYKNRIVKANYLMLLIGLAFIISPKIPITSFCSTTGLCPFYNIWSPIFNKMSNILSERTNLNPMIEINNLWLLIIGIWIVGITLFLIMNDYKKEKEIKKKQ